MNKAQRLYLKNKKDLSGKERRRLIMPAFVQTKKSAYVPKLSRIFLKEEKLEYLGATKTKNLTSRSKAWLYKYLGQNENEFFCEDYFLNLPNQIKIIENNFRIETQTFFVLFTLINSDTFFELFRKGYFLNLPNQIKILENHFRVETQTFFVLFHLINSDTFFLLEMKTTYQPQAFESSVLRLFSFYEDDFENEKEDGTYNFIQLI